MENPLRTSFLLLLTVVGAVVSIITVDVHFKVAAGVATPSFCTFSEQVNCSAVVKSPFSSFVGIPLGLWGFCFYVVCAGLIIGSQREKPFASPWAVAFLSTAATLVSVVLFGVSKFIIGVLCPLCLALYVVNILLCIVSFQMACRQRSHASELGGNGGLWGGFVSLVRLPLIALGDTRVSRRAVNSARIFFLILVAAVVACGVVVKILDRGTVGPDRFAHSAAELEVLIERWSAQPEDHLVVNLEAGVGQDFYKGDRNAPITLIEFSDFQCPFCRALLGELDQLVARYPGKILYVYKNFPLDRSCNARIPSDFHMNACFASRFARCAGEQGRFWEGADLLVSTPELEDNAQVDAVREMLFHRAEQKSFDVTALRSCVDAERTRAQIAAEIAQADQLHVDGTPTIWINNRRLPSVRPTDIDAFIKHLLKTSQPSVPQ